MDAEAKIAILQNQIAELKEGFERDILKLEKEIRELKGSCKATNDTVIVQGEKIRTLEDMKKTMNYIAVGVFMAVATAVLNLVMK